MNPKSPAVIDRNIIYNELECAYTRGLFLWHRASRAALLNFFHTVAQNPLSAPDSNADDF